MSREVLQQWEKWWEAATGRQSSTLERKFLEFHISHPQVYAGLVELTREMKSKGHSKFGLRMLWEVLRWKTLMDSNGEPILKLNDRFISLYARLIMNAEADLQGMFEVRDSKKN